MKTSNPLYPWLLHGVLDDNSSALAIEDVPAPVRITSRRALHVSLRDANGDELIIFDSSSVVLINDPDADPNGTPATLVAGWDDSSRYRYFKLSTSGWLYIAGTNDLGNAQRIALTNLGQVYTDGRLNFGANAPTFATVGVASGTALAANSSRTGAIFTNNSVNTISLNISGGAAVLGSGITLLPGMSWTMGIMDFTTSAITAIASAAGSNLSIQEFS